MLAHVFSIALHKILLGMYCLYKRLASRISQLQMSRAPGNSEIFYAEKQSRCLPRARQTDVAEQLGLDVAVRELSEVSGPA